MNMWGFAAVLSTAGLLALVAVGRFLTATIPHVMLRLATRLWPRSSRRREEIRNEFDKVVREHPERIKHYVAGIVVAGLVDGLGARARLMTSAITISRLTNELQGKTTREPVDPADRRRRRLEWRIRLVFTGGIIAVAPGVVQRSGALAAIMIIIAVAMYVPSARRGIERARRAFVRWWQQRRLKRDYLLGVLLEDYRRHVGSGGGGTDRR